MHHYPNFKTMVITIKNVVYSNGVCSSYCRIFFKDYGYVKLVFLKELSHQYKKILRPSLVPSRSLLLRCSREVWETLRMLIKFFRPEVLGEYLSVTSQLMVESRNDPAENAWGLG